MYTPTFKPWNLMNSTERYSTIQYYKQRGNEGLGEGLEINGGICMTILMSFAALLLLLAIWMYIQEARQVRAKEEKLDREWPVLEEKLVDVSVEDEKQG